MKILILLILTLCLFLMVGCEDKYPVTSPDNQAILTSSGCVECHLDAELLQKVAIPLPPDTATSSGES